ncbi:FHF complex subunit HOOK interacting protein 1A-like [Carassius gibelio]|uniref:FHF complex subunit HOOK interacting protein 1A-like n=1 Tax=Carassius gibelio TaxID=101364 RepID=UPI002278DEB5|nr:FHF complex subunit HOOK interacting protein 1A-like [Carassius gibelio]XP_052401508.1 FHF complex subunit HOOK interacting protein 1A-like [Carassius gibelio]XP_052401509.1 FHF complex subunit HOOK interacting protein 1A-like [Carassius gibelio]XP_052401510.1 FHF complex subunit HOOK interacting protein 1A-like [Carassius gibelio]
MTSMVANGTRGGQPLVLKGVDPETCMIVFRNHWAQVVKILEKHDPLRSIVGGLGGGHGLGGGGGLGSFRFGPVPGDEASAVQNYVEHMLFLLMEEECGQNGAMGPILEFVVMENVLERLFIWSLRREFTDDMKLEQLKMYEMLIGQARQPLLHHKPVLKPLMMLLSSCSGSPSGPSSPAVETELVLLLNQLCCVLAKDPSVLELFFHTSEDQGAANFLIFSLLIPFIHREGSVGQQARDALLLIMALSAENHVVAKHIAENTYFCPVLATGLSGLYSSLPTKLDVPSEEWHCLHREDWQQLPALVQFLNSLEFCNAVIQVAHPSIRDQLVGYIHNGFLVPVLAPALHKLTLEEVMTTTAYLDLFIRSVSEPALLQPFLSFILLHRHDNVHILDTLVSRINTPFQLGTVSLALFRTLIGLYCEDVMLQLVFKYLIPCNHMMLSQRRVLRERDCYSVSAAKFLALTPSCCSPEVIPPPLRQLDSILWSKGTDGSHIGTMESKEVLSEEDDCGNSCVIGSEIHLDVSYLHYLYDAQNSINYCMGACRVWSAPYDGENPPPEGYQCSTLEEAGRTRPSATSRKTPNQMHRSGPTLKDHTATPGLLELEWDDSYDACPTQLQPEEDPETRPIPDEPPKHIQELRRTAIMIVKGSYIEESEFQNDVMVYDLVAQRDARDSCNRYHPSSKPTEAAKHEMLDEPVTDQKTTYSESMSNGLSSPLDEMDSKKRGSQSDYKSLEGEDLMAQYEELIRTLGAQHSPAKTDRELKSPTDLMDEEEDEIDFNSFSPETPEAEKLPSTFGTKPRSGSRGHAVPFTGPFLSVLLSRLENMPSNSLHVNLLLTGILAQLAAYPQPLLRSFLLNTNMVFQPSVRSLYQVLASVKNQIEQWSANYKDFPELLTAAQHCLLARESSLRDSQSPQNADWFHSSEGDIIKTKPNIQPKTVVPLNKTEVYATVLFTEFLKELAAFAQEHSILSHLPTEQ